MNEKAPSLAELQDGLRRALTEPRGVDAALRGARARRVSFWVAETPALGKRLRLAVYADAYFARLLATLESDFPSVRAALGEAEFRRMAAGFVRRHRPATPNLADLGERLPAFVRGDSASRKKPYLPDLAALERAVLRAIYSERGASLDPKRLEAIPPAIWPKLRFEFSPTLSILRSRWDVDRFWNEREKARPAPPRRSARTLAVYRDQDWARVIPIDGREARALERLRGGAALEEACARSAPPLAEWLSRGWLTGVLLPA